MPLPDIFRPCGFDVSEDAQNLLFQWVLDRPPLATLMPAFREQLTEEEVLSILAYIKSTWPEDIRQWQMEGSEQYERQIRENP